MSTVCCPDGALPEFSKRMIVEYRSGRLKIESLQVGLDLGLTLITRRGNRAIERNTNVSSGKPLLDRHASVRRDRSGPSANPQRDVERWLIELTPLGQQLDGKEMGLQRVISR